MLYLNYTVPCTTVLGPGKRYAVWFQGCKKRCRGCINPNGQPLDKNGYFISVDQLFESILEKSENLKGVTISGGEPLLQFGELFQLLKKIKTRTSLDIMLFTGYTIEELADICGNQTNDFLSMLDILIDGEYIEEQNNNEMFRGSANQNIYFFTEKYKTFEEKILNTHNRSIEWHSKPNSDFYMVGIPPKNFEKLMKQEIEKL